MRKNKEWERASNENKEWERASSNIKYLRDNSALVYSNPAASRSSNRIWEKFDISDISDPHLKLSLHSTDNDRPSSCHVICPLESIQIEEKIVEARSHRISCLFLIKRYLCILFQYLRTRCWTRQLLSSVSERYFTLPQLFNKPFPERRAIARAHLRTRLKSPRRAIHRTPKQTKTC